MFDTVVTFLLWWFMVFDAQAISHIDLHILSVMQFIGALNACQIIISGQFFSGFLWNKCKLCADDWKWSFRWREYICLIILMFICIIIHLMRGLLFQKINDNSIYTIINETEYMTFKMYKYVRRTYPEQYCNPNYHYILYYIWSLL